MPTRDMMIQRPFETWLRGTRVLQERAYGHRPWEMEGDEWAAYVRTQVTAAIAELGELLEELDWKPWSTRQGPPELETVEYHRAVGELVDLLHFVGNLAVALRLTDAKLSHAYVGKQQRNLERQLREGGYDSRANKCPGCGRAKDDVGTREVRIAWNKLGDQCLVCGYVVPRND